jgi:dTDP-4-amino-4,6-dideoxygalactose transaminase
MADNWFSPRGPRLEEFGKRWAAFVGRKYGWPVSSGTGALHLALLGLGVGRGDVVAVPSYTCSPGVYPVTYVGATPLFIDCELETYGMDPDDLEKKLDEHTRLSGPVKAAIPVHLYGAGCRNRVLDVLRAYGVAVIEDACESDGGLYRGTEVPLGRYGDVACFSFRGDKVLTALGTGGMFVTDDPEVFRKMKLYSDLGLKNEATVGRYRDLEVVGYNYEISNPAAAFGMAQIDRMGKIIEGRRRAAAAWHAAIAEYARDEELRPPVHPFAISICRVRMPASRSSDWRTGRSSVLFAEYFGILEDYRLKSHIQHSLVSQRPKAHGFLFSENDGLQRRQ